MAVPTLTNLDHVCLTVPDLRQAMDFFVEVLGGEKVLVAGPYQDDETDDVGYVHLSFRVGDLDRARACLVEHGLTMHGEPTAEGPASPLAGCRWQHFETPWGLHMEIVEWPDSMPFEADTPARLTSASPSWDNRARGA